MPYIPEDRRTVHQHSVELPKTKGELNYAITMLMIEYVLRQGKSYTNVSEAIAAADDAAAEMRRRVLDPYEDEMIIKNGDCYPPELLA